MSSIFTVFSPFFFCVSTCIFHVNLSSRMMLGNLMFLVWFSFTPRYESFTIPSVFLVLVKRTASVLSGFADSPLVLHQLSATLRPFCITSVTVLSWLLTITLDHLHRLVPCNLWRSVFGANCRPHSKGGMIITFGKPFSGLYFYFFSVSL